MRIIVIGSGNWGTTLAIMFCGRNDVTLWTIDQKEAAIINQRRENVISLPGAPLPENLVVEAKFTSPVQQDDILVIAIPSRKIEDLAAELHDVPPCIIVNASKGVKHTDLSTIREVFARLVPQGRFANLSGPTIARELAEGLPAKAILASDDIALLFQLQETLANDLLHYEFSRDVQGIELCASLKGLIAIAVGLADGFGFKTNIFGLIMTYGLDEFTRVMEFLGVRTKTVYGIAGMGDLITTCLSENSRNRRFGRLLAQGRTTEQALEEVGMEVEGVSMAKTVQKLTKFNLSIPLISCVTRIIFEQVEDSRAELLNTLMKN
ncbi:MAG: NAD(P)H-dependent glycerol-3-phosphate dehydrogenase [Candidatus Cloacimonetes bacterium]|nr:NAD(P)H-dependent glycerol-3-phosphate dehydrogenase [Candidatus Cloacimonadota bacterium]